MMALAMRTLYLDGVCHQVVVAAMTTSCHQLKRRCDQYDDESLPRAEKKKMDNHLLPAPCSDNYEQPEDAPK